MTATKIEWSTSKKILVFLICLFVLANIYLGIIHIFLLVKMKRAPSTGSCHVQSQAYFLAAIPLFFIASIATGLFYYFLAIKSSTYKHRVAIYIVTLVVYAAFQMFHILAIALPSWKPDDKCANTAFSSFMEKYKLFFESNLYISLGCIVLLMPATAIAIQHVPL